MAGSEPGLVRLTPPATNRHFERPKGVEKSHHPERKVLLEPTFDRVLKREGEIPRLAALARDDGEAVMFV